MRIFYKKRRKILEERNICVNVQSRVNMETAHTIDSLKAFIFLFSFKRFHPFKGRYLIFKHLKLIRLYFRNNPNPFLLSKLLQLTNLNSTNIFRITYSS